MKLKLFAAFLLTSLCAFAQLAPVGPASPVTVAANGKLNSNYTGGAGFIAQTGQTFNFSLAAVVLPSSVTTASNTITVASVATLRLTTAASGGQYVQTAGYYAANDGGAGVYAWNSSSTATDNGGTIIQVTGVVTGRWLLLYNGVINVKQFGAYGDNSHDDTTAINAAFTAANNSTIYFPNGTYLVTASLTPGSNTISIIGQDRYQSIIRANGTGLTGGLIEILNGQNHFSISNLTLDWNNKVVSGNPGMVNIGGVGTGYWQINNCEILNWTANMIAISAGSTTGCPGCVISNNNIAGPATPGHGPNVTEAIQFLVDPTNNNNTLDLQILNNKISGAGTNAMTARCHVIGNTVTNFGYGAAFSVGNNSDCAHNIIYNSSGPDTNSDYPSGFEVYGGNSRYCDNVIYNMSGAGIDCVSPYSVITGNMIFNCGQNVGLPGIQLACNGGTGLEPAWVSGGTYTAGPLTQVSNGGKNYVCIVSVSGSTTAPGSDPTHWVIYVLYAANNSLVADNLCFDNQASQTQTYGIALAAGVLNVDLHGNKLDGNLSGTILIGSGVTFQPFRAEFSGLFGGTVKAAGAFTSNGDIALAAGSGNFGGDSNFGAEIAGTGVDNDVTIFNSGGNVVALVPTGTTNFSVVGTVGSAGLLATGAVGVGYSTGAGGSVTQITSRTTGVTLNADSGAITLVSAAGSATPATFTVTDSAVAATDGVSVQQASGTDAYEIFVTAIGTHTFKITSFTTGGTTTEQPVFKVTVIKGASS